METTAGWGDRGSRADRRPERPARTPGLAIALLWAAALPGAAGAAGTDLCKAASAAAVGQALHAVIVRAEAPQSDAGCEYSSTGTPANATGSHAVAMTGALAGTPLDPQAAKAIAAFSNGVLGEASTRAQAEARHPGEVTVLAFTVSRGNAQQEMKTNRDMMGRMSPLTPVAGLGDEAFESSGSVLMVRKGDRFIRFLFTQCGCAAADVIPLARQIVASL